MSLKTDVYQFVEAIVNVQRAATPEAQDFAVALCADAFRACFMDLVQEGIEKANRIKVVKTIK